VSYNSEERELIKVLNERVARSQEIYNPIVFAKDYIRIIPNQAQSDFLVDMANPLIINHALQGPRGGGKTYNAALSSVWGQLKYDALEVHVMAGSLYQTKRFYKHVKEFCAIPRVRRELKGEPMKTITEFKDGGYIECLPASEKSARSPHVDWLYVDEFVQVDQDLIVSAFPVVNESDRPKRIFLTTASQTKGAKSLPLWITWWDNASDLQMRTYEWTIQDCSWMNPLDADLAKRFLDFIDPELFKIEYLGQRGEWIGAVFKRTLIEHAVQTSKEHPPYDPLSAEGEDLESIAGVDWGVVNPTVVTVIQKQGEYYVVISVIGKSHQDVRFWCDEVIPAIQLKYKVQNFYCDSSHKMQNKQLKNNEMPVVEVAFSKYKTQMIGAVRYLLEYKLLKINPKFEKTIRQLKMYCYDPDTEKPLKSQDDYVDSLMLACWGASGRGLDKFELIDLDEMGSLFDKEMFDFRDPRF
jgi:phage terminase large subunit